MATSPLTAFWIVPQREGVSHHGFGVTAFSLHDALRIIDELGYGGELPADTSRLIIRENIQLSDLDPNHVIPNIGPIGIRGMWYPLQQIGI